MRIALISPKWNEMVNSYPPLGLGYLAAVLEADGHEVSIFDLGLEPKTPIAEDIRRIVATAPDLVGLTAMTNNYHSAEAIMAGLKEQLHCPLVIGGPHVTLFPERIAADPRVDYVVYGEGEETMRELVRVLLQEGHAPSAGALRQVQGLCFSAGREIICNPSRPLIRDLDSLPFPSRHLFSLDRYPLYAPNGERMVTLLSSRGCPFNCSYCFKGIVGRTYRQRSPDSIIAEIRHLTEHYGYRHFYFIDDLFTIDRRRLTAITQRMIDEKLDIRWQCLARVDRVTPETLQLMYRAGCREVHYGIESGNPEILESLGKRITMEQVRQAVAWTAKAGILAKGYFMLGLPGDTEETMQQTIHFASELELDQAMFSLTTPFPGTRLWNELKAQRPEIEFNQDFSKAFYYNNYDDPIKPFFNLSAVSDERLAELAVEAQTRFQEAKRQRKYLHALGPVMGTIAYQLSHVPFIRRAARLLPMGSPLRRLRVMAKFAAHSPREEDSQAWNS
jgi:anaerobic magnesium-protoporphyrin IX monomethyl ester cyclase